MSIMDGLPGIIRLPLRAIFGIIAFAAFIGLVVGVAVGGYYLITGAWWLYITFDITFWAVNTLLLLVVLTVIGAWMESQ